MIAYPIKILNQEIGVIDIQSNDGDRKWTEDDIALIKMVADRAAIALENARLLDITLRRASKEQAISEITTKIGSSIDIQNILKTAVEELGQTISASTVSIYLQEDD
jgi:GAF domain-containing protein